MNKLLLQQKSTTGLEDYILWRIRRNKNCIIIWNGPTGSGKTYAASAQAESLARLTGTHFSAKNNVDFNFTGLLKKMNLEINNKPGTNFIFEEVGITGGGGSNREWQSKINRLFFTFLQTARYRNQVLHFTCPHFSFLDKGSRSLVHMQMIPARNIDFKKKLSHWKPFMLQTNMTTGKIYFKYLRVKSIMGLRKLHRVEYGLPSKEYLADYEQAKKVYLDSLITETRQEEKPKEVYAKIPVNRVKAYAERGLCASDIGRILGHHESGIKYWLKKIRAGYV